MIFKYFLEIKSRVLLILIVWLSIIGVGYLYKEVLLFILIKPSFYSSHNSLVYFISTSITEIFSTYIQLIYFIGNQVTLVFICYHLLLFFSPGLYEFEYKNLKFIYLVGILLWFIAIIFLNKLVLPFSWDFFLSFQSSLNNQTHNLYFEAKIIEYLEFYILMYRICNYNCQFFVLLFIFIDYFKKDLTFVKRFRKLFYFFFFLVATITTPPDVLSQLVIGACSIIICELIMVSIILKDILTEKI